ncbi:MAG TPA: family 16 glycosylhydrolase [Polyangiaceae bacterium]|nr:family 16 glycosylhydrolase [Polyangiaceae bacterium]
MFRTALPTLCFVAVALVPQVAAAVTSAELYTGESYRYGRVEARVRFAAGDGVVSSFFLWKDGSEQTGNYWNELDYEKLGADCHLETNAFYGKPAVTHSQRHSLNIDLCGGYHTYVYEWTPEAIVWTIDGMEIRRETGAAAAAYADNAAAGMQIRFNIWPGNASFGGNFSPSILPVHEYVDWVQYSSYANGAFTLEWRDDFDAPQLASRWLTGSWASPKNLSTHDARNVNIVNGYAVLSLTADDAVGPAGAAPEAVNNGTAGGPSVPVTNTSNDGGCSVGSPRSGSFGTWLLACFAGIGVISRRLRRRSLEATRS